jgi:hypothetical protein
MQREVIVTVRPAAAAHPVASIYGVLTWPMGAHGDLAGADPDSKIFAIKTRDGELSGLLELSAGRVVDGDWGRAEDHALGGDFIWVEIDGLIVSVGTEST